MTCLRSQSPSQQWFSALCDSVWTIRNKNTQVHLTNKTGREHWNKHLQANSAQNKSHHLKIKAMQIICFNWFPCHFTFYRSPLELCCTCLYRAFLKLMSVSAYPSVHQHRNLCVLTVSVKCDSKLCVWMWAWALHDRRMSQTNKALGDVRGGELQGAPGFTLHVTSCCGFVLGLWQQNSGH